MSVSIGWRPKNPETVTRFGRGSALYEALEKVFGKFPITLMRTDIVKLEVMSACGYDEIDTLIPLFSDNDAIELVADE